MTALQSFHAASPTARGILLMMLAVFFFTTMDAVAKGLVGGYPLMQVIFFRFAGQLVIVVVLLRTALPAELRTRFPGLHLARAALQFATVSLFFASLAYIGLAEAQALTDLNPVLITLGAALFLGERLTRDRVLCVIAAMIGAMIVIRPGAGVFTPAALLPIAAAVTYAASALITRKVGQHESPWASMIYTALFGVTASGATLPWGWTPIAAPDLWRFAALGCLGAAAQLCIIRSFSIAEASVVAPFAYLGLIFAVGWGIVLYGDWPDAATLAGALVIVSAGLYVWHRETRGARSGG